MCRTIFEEVDQIELNVQQQDGDIFTFVLPQEAKGKKFRVLLEIEE